MVESLLGLLSSECSTISVRKEVGGSTRQNTDNYKFAFHKSVPDSYEILWCDVMVASKDLQFLVVYTAPNCPTLCSEQLVNAFSDSACCDFPIVITGDLTFPDILGVKNIQPHLLHLRISENVRFMTSFSINREH